SIGAELCKQRLADFDPFRGVGQFRHVDVEREGEDTSFPLDPACPPADRSLRRREVPARFGEEDGAILFLLPEDLPGYGLRARAGVELSLGKQRNEPGLLDGADPQWSIEPEPVDDRTNLAISVPQAVEPHPV